MTTECFLQDYEDVLTPKEVQHILQISRNTLYKRLSEGSIRSVRIGKFYRIPKIYLVEYLNANTYGERKSLYNKI